MMRCRTDVSLAPSLAALRASPSEPLFRSTSEALWLIQAGSKAVQPNFHRSYRSAHAGDDKEEVTGCQSNGALTHGSVYHVLIHGSDRSTGADYTTI